MNSLKKFPMAVTLLGIGAASSFAEIKVTDNLALSGFMDMSATYNADSEAGTMSFDQFEVDFMYTFDKLTARADINSLGGGDVSFEQGFVTYGMGAANLTLGRFLSASGFEAAEPTGLYQYSVSKTLVYGGYQNGLALSYNGGAFGLYGAFVTNPWSSADVDVTNPGVEAQLSLMPTPEIVAKVTYVADFAEDTAGETSNKQLINAWAQYAAGAITAAAEFNYLINYDETADMGYLAMINFKFGGNYAITVRHSGYIPEDGDLASEVTLSPSVVLTPNWSALAEARIDMFKDAADESTQVATFAVESIFTF